MNLTPQENSLIAEAHPEALARMDAKSLKDLQSRLRHAATRTSACCGARVRREWRPKEPVAPPSRPTKSAEKRWRFSTRRWLGVNQCLEAVSDAE